MEMATPQGSNEERIACFILEQHHSSLSQSMTSTVVSICQILYSKRCVDELTLDEVESEGISLEDKKKLLLATVHLGVSDDHRKLHELATVLDQFKETKSVANNIISDYKDERLKAVKKAASEAVRMNIIDLKNAIAATFEDIILTCEQETLISSDFKTNLLDPSTNKATRCSNFITHIHNLVGVQPAHLDTFLCILNGKDLLASEVANSVAKSYGYNLPKYERIRALGGATSVVSSDDNVEEMVPQYDQMSNEDRASDILRTHYNTLSQSLKDPVNIARLFHKEGVLTIEEYSMVHSTSSTCRSAFLLRLVRKAVHGNHQHLKVFGRVLQQLTAGNERVGQDILNDYYEAFPTENVFSKSQDEYTSMAQSSTRATTGGTSVKFPVDPEMMNEFTKIKGMFGLTFHKIKTTLMKCNVPVDDVKSFCKFTYPKCSQEINDCQTMEDVLIFVNKKCTLIDISILEKLLGVSEHANEAKQHIQDYQHAIDDFSQKMRARFLLNQSLLPDGTPHPLRGETITFVMKWDPESLSLDDIEKLQTYAFGSLFENVKVIKMEPTKSVVITCSFPFELTGLLKAEAMKNLKLLKKNGLLKLTIGYCTIWNIRDEEEKEETTDVQSTNEMVTSERERELEQPLQGTADKLNEIISHRDKEVKAPQEKVDFPTDQLNSSKQEATTESDHDSAKFKFYLHVVDVGHGLTTVLEFRTQTETKCYLYDAGYQRGTRYRNKFLKALTNLPCFNKSTLQFSGIVISHPHFDHYCGLKYLLENSQYNVKLAKLLVNEQFDPNALLPGANWEKLPIELPYDTSAEYNSIEGQLHDFKILYRVDVPPSIYSLIEIKSSTNESKNSKGLNKNCLIMSVKLPKHPNPEIILTGDAPYDYFENKKLQVSVFQVPHHGSKSSLPTNKFIPSYEFIENAAIVLSLYHNRHLLSSEIYQSFNFEKNYNAQNFAEYLKKNEKSIKEGPITFMPNHVIPNANNPEGCYSLNNSQISWYCNNRDLFTENTRRVVDIHTMYWCQRLTVLKESIEWAYVYKHIEAELYILSAGSKYSLPNPEVLFGIMLACKWNGIKCRIALTNNYKLDAYFRLPTDAFTLFTADNTEVWYLNNANGPISYFTIDPHHQSCDTVSYNDHVVTIGAKSREVLQKGMHKISISHAIGDKSKYINAACTERSLNLHNDVSKQLVQHSKKSSTFNPAPLDTSVSRQTFLREEVNLDEFLHSVGNDTPSDDGYSIKTVLEIVLGPLAFSQFSHDARNDNNCELMLHLNSLISCLLAFKAKGLSKFRLNYTRTAAISAIIDVYLPRRHTCSINDKTIVKAYFNIENAKAHNSKIILYLKCDGNDFVQYDISKCIASCHSNGDVTLAEYVSQQCSHGNTRSAEAWVEYKTFNLKLGETLFILFGLQKSISILQKFPASIILKATECRLRNHLTSVRFNDANEVEEGHFYIKLPCEFLEISLTPHLDVVITNLVLHVYPLHDIFEQAIQLKGNGYILNQHHPIEISVCQSYSVPYNIEITLVNKYTPEDIFETLKIQVNEIKVKLDANKHYEVKIIASQLFKNNEMLHINGIYFIDAASYKDACSFPSLPPQVALFTSQSDPKFNSRACVAVFDPFSTSPIAGIDVSFVLSSSNVCFDCNCSAYFSNNMIDFTLTTLYKPFIANHHNDNVKSVFQFLKDTCSSFEFKMTDNVLLVIDLPIFNSILHTVVPKKIKLMKSGSNSVISVEVQLSIPKVELCSKPHLALQDVNASILYNDDTFDMQFEGTLTFESEIEGKSHKHLYSTQFIFPTSDNPGILSITNGSKDLTLEAILRSFTTLDTKQMPDILLSALSLSIRKLDIQFSLSPDKELEISMVRIVVHLQRFPLGLVDLTDIELIVQLKRKAESSQYDIFLQIETLVCDVVYLKLTYDSENALLSGKGAVCLDSTMTASDALQIFKADKTHEGYGNLNQILKAKFMQAFQSAAENNPNVNVAGLMNFIEISIRLPSKKSDSYSIQWFCLQVKDVVTIKNFVIDTIQFQYSKKSLESNKPQLEYSEKPSLESNKTQLEYSEKPLESNKTQLEYSEKPLEIIKITSTARIMAIIRTLRNTESMKIIFDVTKTSEKPLLLTAVLMPGDNTSCAALTIQSVIEFVGCDTPILPDVGLPLIFNIGLIYGKISLVLRPLDVRGVDVAILIPEWVIFNDPFVRVQKMIIRAVYERNEKDDDDDTNGKETMALILDSCTLTFNRWDLQLSGIINSEMIKIRCNITPTSSSTCDLKFDSLLHDYTPSTEPCPEIPKSINLPPMDVCDIKPEITLKEKSKTLSINALISPSVPWKFSFGDNEVSIIEIGGALEWTKCEEEKSYKAYIFGRLQLTSHCINIDARMMLGSGIDSVLIATVTRIHLGDMADTLTSPFGESLYNSLVPENMSEITPITATLAINITKKQLFMSGNISDWFSCTLLVGYLYDQQQMDYAIMLSLKEGFKFGMLSESLAFFDDYISVCYVNLVVSSVDLTNLNNSVMSAFQQASTQNIPDLENPFSLVPSLYSNKMSNEEIKRGTTLLALLNAHTCKKSNGVIGKLYELGDSTLEKTDIIVKAFVDSTMSVMKFSAYIEKIRLFDMLEFSDILLQFDVEKFPNAPTQYMLKLHGTIVFDLADMDYTSCKYISFDGSLSITNHDLQFEASTTDHSQDRNKLDGPVGINISLRKLALELYYTFGSSTPEVKVYGDLTIDCVQLQGNIYFIGSSFKVFEIQLKNRLSLTALFQVSDVDWLAGSLDIKISEGQFYYAKENIKLRKGNREHYDRGFHLECTIILFSWDFIITADIPEKNQLILSGRSKKKIDLVFAKLTGIGEHRHNGPELRYNHNKISLLVGVELFNHPCFDGEITYYTQYNYFEGEIRYPGKILNFFDGPSLRVRWSKSAGFEIVKFEFPLLGSLFNLLGAIAKFAHVLYQLISGAGWFSWDINLNLTTGTNPDPDRYLVKLILQGTVSISICGLISCKIIPLPDIPLRIVKCKDFSLSKLPQYILSCLWESAGDICMSLLKYINPINLLLNIGKTIINGVICVVKKVAKIVVTVAKKIWSGIKSFFGFSAFLVDSETNSVLGYVYAGKNESKLCNIEYTVNNFAPFLIAHAIKQTARSLHTTAKACVHAGAEDLQNEIGHIDELNEQTQELDLQLSLVADKVLAIKNIELEVEDNSIIIKWDAGNEEGQYFTDDKGDIHYHAKVVMVTVDSTGSVNIVEIFNDILTVEYDTEVQSVVPKNSLSEIDNSSTQEDDNQPSIDETTDETQEDDNNNDCLDQNQQTIDETIDETQPKIESNDEFEGNISDATLEDSNATCKSPSLSKKISLDSELVQSNLHQAVYICATIEPTVTLLMMTLPPDKPILIKSDKEFEDKIWMKSIKEEIKSRGIKQEVTMNGGKGSTFYVLKHPSAKVDSSTTASAEYHYFEQEQLFAIKGKISPVENNNECLIQIFDAGDMTTMIKSAIFSPNEHNVVEFLISFGQKELPEHSPGLYKVSYILLADKVVSSELITIPDFQLDRCLPAYDVHIAPPTSPEEMTTLLWKLRQKKDYSEKISEETSDDCSSDEAIFQVALRGTLSKTEYMFNGEDLETDKLDECEVEVLFDCTSVVDGSAADQNTNSFSFPFRPQSLYEQYSIPLTSGITITCSIVSLSSSNQHLPSLSQSTEVIIVAAPTHVKVHESNHNDHNESSRLYISWSYTMHAVKSEIEFVNESSSNVEHSKIHQHEKGNKSVLDNFSVDRLVSINDFKKICPSQSQSSNTYILQVYSLGFGEKMYKSLVPAVSEDKILVVPLELLYDSVGDTIEVRTSVMPDLPQITVSLYEYNNEIGKKDNNDDDLDDGTYKYLCSQSTKSSIGKLSAKMNLKECRSHLKTGSYVTAYAYQMCADHHIFYTGISLVDLKFLPDPHDVTVQDDYGVIWDLNVIRAKWSCDEAVDSQIYQFGLQSVNGDIIYCCWDTKRTHATVDFSSLPLSIVNSLHFQFFVKTISSNKCNNSITSNPLINNTLYQCIITPNGRRMFYTGVTVQKLLLHFIIKSSIATSSVLNHVPVKATRVLFESRKLFPGRLIPSEILSKFWSDHNIFATGNLIGISRNGIYNYCCDLINEKMHAKLQKESKFTAKNVQLFKVKKPEKWHSQVYLLLHIRYSVKSKLPRANNKVELKYNLKVFGSPKDNSDVSRANKSIDINKFEKIEADEILRNDESEPSVNNTEDESAVIDENELPLNDNQELLLTSDENENKLSNAESQPLNDESNNTSSFFSKITGGAGNLIKKGFKKLKSTLQSTKVIYHEKQKTPLPFYEKAGSTTTKNAIYIVRLDVDRCNEVSLDLSLYNCVLEDVHLFERFV